MQTANESSAQSLSVLELLIPLLSRIGVPEEYWHTLVRKLAHMTEFAVLGLLWSAALLSGTGNMPCTRWPRRGMALSLCLVVAIADESIQRLIPGRSGELRDVCIDLLGSMLGILAVAAISFLRRKQVWSEEDI